MKILFLGDARSPHIERWLSYFVRKGHEVHLGTAYPQGVSGGFEGISVHDISSRVKIQKLNFLGMLQKVYGLIRKIRPQILHAHYINCYGWLGSLTNFHPLVITVWGGDILSDQGAFGRFGSKTLTKWTLRRADLVTADSPNLIEACASLGMNRSSIRHITFGVDRNFFSYKPDTTPLRERLNIPRDSFVVFSPRRVDKLMNIDRIIRTIPEVIQKIPQTIFLIKIFPGQVDNVYLRDVQKLSEDLGVVQHVRYCDDPKYVTVRDCYHLADVVVSVPLSDGMPATIFEAMASGTPLIVSDLAGYEGVITDGESGLCVRVGDVNSLADAIIDLLMDEEERRRLVKNGFEIVKTKGDFTEEMKKVESLYDDLVQKHFRSRKVSHTHTNLDQ